MRSNQEPTHSETPIFPYVTRVRCIALVGGIFVSVVRFNYIDLIQ